MEDIAKLDEIHKQNTSKKRYIDDENPERITKKLK